MLTNIGHYIVPDIVRGGMGFFLSIADFLQFLVIIHRLESEITVEVLCSYKLFHQLVSSVIESVVEASYIQEIIEHIITGDDPASGRQWP